MKRINFQLFASLLVALGVVAACDSNSEKSGKSEVARRNTMDTGAVTGAGFSIVQPDLPPSADDAIASQGAAALALDGTSTDTSTSTSTSTSTNTGIDVSQPNGGGFGRRFQGNPFIPPYFANYVYKLTVSQNGAVVKESSGPYVPNRPLELRGLDAGKYTIQLDVSKGDQLRWTGTNDVDVAKDQVVQARVSMHRASQTGSDVVITPVVGDQHSCDYIPSLFGKLCLLGRFECSLTTASATDGKAVTAWDFCGENFARWRVLQKACNQGLKPTSAEISAITCTKLKLVPDLNENK